MSDTEWEVDILDPAWGSFENVMERRKGYFIAMRHLDELSRHLTAEADADYQRQMAAEPAAYRERREQRERTLKDLIVRADSAIDPGEAAKLWAAVDAMLSEPGAEA